MAFTKITDIGFSFDENEQYVRAYSEGKEIQQINVDIHISFLSHAEKIEVASAFIELANLLKNEAQNERV